MIKLDSLKQLFGRKSTPASSVDASSSAKANYAPFRTVGVVEQIRSQVDEASVRPLPLIGHLPSQQQKYLSVVVLSAGLIVMAVSTYVYNKNASQLAEYKNNATELQMLSQQIARTSSQAVLAGNANAFDTLRAAHAQFAKDLNVLMEKGAVGGASKEKLKAITDIWKGTYNPKVKTILSNQTTLNTLNSGAAAINANDKALSESVANLVGLLQGEASGTNEAIWAYQLETLTQKIAKNVNSVLVSDVELGGTLSSLGSDVTKFQEVVSGLQEGNEGLSIVAVKNPEAQAELRKLDAQIDGFQNFVDLFTEKADELSAARSANEEVNKSSAALLENAKNLSVIYQEHGSSTKFLLLGVLGLVLLALGVWAFVKADTIEGERRRIDSEKENKRNQEAILRLLNEMSDLADGDLTVHASVTEDLTGAIADSMNYTIEELRNLILNINKATEQVTTASAQAQTISVELLDAAQKQSQEIVEANASVQHIASSIAEVTETASESASVAEQSLHAAEKGTKAVENSIAGMNEIREQIQETAKRIKRLGESSQEIGEIVELISDITEQTNVLALNAAIQAASAGEAGRGFTVVAEEVQRLAERSGEATKQIGAIVKTIQTDTHDAVAAMELSTHGVVEGAKLSDAAGQALTEIRTVSDSLAELIQKISAATQSQTNMAAQVSKSMENILQVTEQTTEGTKQTAVSIGQLTSLASDLKASVSGFKLS